MAPSGEAGRATISGGRAVIFVTVGAQMPFDRLIRAVDEWAATQTDIEILAQIGNAEFIPQNLEYRKFLEPAEFKRIMREATAIIAHAGTGSIINALEYKKPILILPRRADLRETRNDHQIATAERFQSMKSIAVAFDENELGRALSKLSQVKPGDAIEAHASPELLNAIQEFVNQGKQPHMRTHPSPS